METMFRDEADWDPVLLEAEWQKTTGSASSPEAARVGG
jgi:hypothetical protein